MDWELLTTDELEKRTGIDKATWRHWIRIGLVPSIKLGKRVLVSRLDYERFIEENRRPAKTEDKSNA